MEPNSRQIVTAASSVLFVAMYSGVWSDRQQGLDELRTLCEQNRSLFFISLLELAARLGEWALASIHTSNVT
jgi:hypothetical protein